MRILVTNDDGVTAPGLAALEAIAAQVAGPDGEVWVVAPAFEQSGVGHCISYTKPFMVTELAPRRFAAEGSPADCVLAALHVIMEQTPPDLVLSGVNRGNNSAENTLYSGTIGGAMEAALQGLPAMALSQYYGPANAHLDDPFETARAFGAEVVNKALRLHAPEHLYQLFFNINFPPVPAADVKGIKAAPQGRRVDTVFGAEQTNAPTGRKFLWLKGGDQRAPVQDGSDAGVNLDGYISVTPMRADLTDHSLLKDLEDHLA